MEGWLDLLKLEGKLALLTIYSVINTDTEEAGDYINNTIDELEKDGYLKYVFDLHHLNLANSRFIGLIAKRYYNLMGKGGRIAILNAQDMVKRSFEMSGLTDVLQFYTEKEEAIKSFKD